MRKFIFNILLFSLSLGIMNLILNHFGDELYLGEYKVYSLKFNSFILSDSHGLPLKSTEKYGIYNFSAESDSYFDMERKLNFLLQKSRVDTIYITVDDYSLSPYRESSNNLDRSAFYSTRKDYSNTYLYLIDKIRFNVSFFQPKKRSLLKSYFLSKIKNNLLKIKSVKIQEKSSWEDITRNQRLYLAEKRYKQQFPTKQKSINLEQSLKNIINICKNNNIVLIGIKYPMTKEYISIMDDFSYGASKLFHENGLKVYDFLDVYRNEEQYFKDQDHLNLNGGEKFTKLMFEKY